MSRSLVQGVEDAIRAISFLKKEESLRFMETCAAWIADCFQKGGKLLIAGNGGSLCDAMHFAEELTGQFRKARPALPAIALADPSHLTCVGNDMGFSSVFSRGVEAFGKKGDLLISLTTSGNSLNILAAVESARHREMKTISFLGKEGEEGLWQRSWERRQFLCAPGALQG